MEIREAYNVWADQYDSNINKTRDLEAISIRSTLADISFVSCLEIGCGTGKNTEWLLSKAKEITAVDFSEEMLLKAKNKIQSDKVLFCQADITEDWIFLKNHFDLITFSLVLEHIENLDDIFKKAADHIVPGGYAYVGELHPFKQYTGSKAKFDTETGPTILTCYTHHLSDFIQSAQVNGFSIFKINEFFDNNERSSIPRILSLLFIKN